MELHICCDLPVSSRRRTTTSSFDPSPILTALTITGGADSGAEDLPSRPPELTDRSEYCFPSSAL